MQFAEDEIEKLRTTIENLKKYSVCDDVSKQRIITINADLKSKIKILEATNQQLTENIDRLTGELEKLHAGTLPTTTGSLGSPDRSQMSPTKIKYLEWRKNNIIDPDLNNTEKSGISKGDIPYKFLGKVLLGLPVGSKTALRPVFLRWWVRANKKPVRDVMLKFLTRSRVNKQVALWRFIGIAGPLVGRKEKRFGLAHSLLDLLGRLEKKYQMLHIEKFYRKISTNHQKIQVLKEIRALDEFSDCIDLQIRGHLKSITQSLRTNQQNFKFLVQKMMKSMEIKLGTSLTQLKRHKNDCLNRDFQLNSKHREICSRI